MDSQTPLYATDVTDAEGALLKPRLPPDAPTGRPRAHPLRTMLNAIVYALRTGCAWRFLPQEWPAWQTVYGYFRRGRRDGTWERIHRTLRQQLRLQLHRAPEPSAGSVDSQSVTMTAVGGIRGYDGAKKRVGRKRHVLADTEGLVHAVNVHPASTMDRDGIKLVLDEATRARLSRMRLLWLDAGDNGRGKGKDWVEQTTGWQVQTVKAIHRFKRSWGPNEPSSGPDCLVEVSAHPWFPEDSTPLGGGAHRRLVLAQPPTEQRLRAPVRHARGLDLPDHDPPHAPSTRALLKEL